MSDNNQEKRNIFKGKNLRPIIIKKRPSMTTGEMTSTESNIRQIFLLKAMNITQDPKKLRKMLQFKTVADVYRTLDKIAIRKEYHEALARAGISLDFIAKNLHSVIKSGKDGDKIAAIRMIMKSIGLESYDVAEGAGSGTWEEELIRSLEKEKELNEHINGSQENPKSIAGPSDDIPEYEVKTPEIPEEVKALRKDEDELTGNLYSVYE